MKKLCILSLLMFLMVSLKAQDSRLRLSVNTDIANKPINSMIVSPSLQYYLFNWFAVGANVKWSNYMGFEQKDININARCYMSRNCFVQAGANTDFDNAVYDLGAGYTAMLGHRWFVEPGFRFNHSKDEDKFGMVLGVGLKL